MDKDDEVSELKRGWLDHPFTRHLLKQAQAQHESDWVRLKGACAVSTDPNVRGRYADWFCSARELSTLEKGAYAQ